MRGKSFFKNFVFSLFFFVLCPPFFAFSQDYEFEERLADQINAGKFGLIETYAKNSVGSGKEKANYLKNFFSKNGYRPKPFSAEKDPDSKDWYFHYYKWTNEEEVWVLCKNVGTQEKIHPLVQAVRSGASPKKLVSEINKLVKYRIYDGNHEDWKKTIQTQKGVCADFADVYEAAFKKARYRGDYYQLRYDCETAEDGHAVFVYYWVQKDEWVVLSNNFIHGYYSSEDEALEFLPCLETEERRGISTSQKMIEIISDIPTLISLIQDGYFDE